MIVRIEPALDRVDRRIPPVWTQRVQPRRRRARDHVTACRNQSCRGRRTRPDLIDVDHTDQIRALRSHIACGHNHVFANLPLYVQAPLLRVRRMQIHRSAAQRQRSQRNHRRACRRVVQLSAGDSDRLHQRRISKHVLLQNAHQRGVIEDAVAASNTGLTIAPRIPREPHTRGQIQALLPAHLRAIRRCGARNGNPVQPVAGVGHQVARVWIDLRSVGRRIQRPVKVGKRLPVRIRLTEVGVPQPHVQREVRGQTVVILHIQLESPGADIRRQIQRCLAEGGHVAQQEVRPALHVGIRRGKRRRARCIGERERTRVGARRIFLLAIEVVLEAHLHRMPPFHPVGVVQQVVVVTEVVVRPKPGNGSQAAQHQRRNAAQSSGERQVDLDVRRILCANQSQRFGNNGPPRERVTPFRSQVGAHGLRRAAHIAAARRIGLRNRHVGQEDIGEEPARLHRRNRIQNQTPENL